MSELPDATWRRLLRMWNPWYLRRNLDLLACDIDQTTTDGVQTRRFIHGMLAGENDPNEQARRYSVRGRTLHIDATRRPR